MMMPTSRPLTIVHVSTQRGWHGGEEQAFQLICGLKSRGHRCIVHARNGGEFALRLKKADVEVHQFLGRGRNPLTLLKLRRMWRQLKPDVIHFHDSHSLSGPGFAAWRLGVPARIASRRINLPMRSPLVYRHLCDRIICVSKAVAAVCEQRGIAHEKLRAVYDGVDPQRVAGGDRERGRKSLAAHSDDFVILTVASLNELKGHRYLLQALPTVLAKHPNVRLALAGDGTLRHELEQLAHELGVADRVQYLGYRTDVPDLLHAADLFVLPSHTEGLGSSLIDVMFARLPIVTTDAGGIPEVVGNHALIVPPRSSDSLATAILQVIESSSQCLHRVDLAERRARELFTADRMVESTLAVYMETLQAKAV